VLGTFTTDEQRGYTMLITQNHWMGLVAADALDSRVLITVGVPPHSTKNHNALQAVQKRGTAMFRRHNGCQAVRELRAFVSGSFTLSEDRSGWIFARNSDHSVYVGLFATNADDAGKRYALSDAVAGNGSGTWIRFLRRDAFVVLEVAQADEYEGFEVFVKDIRDNPRRWVTDNEFEYHGRGGALTMHRDATLPKIDGQTVELCPHLTYNSPYLRTGRTGTHITIAGTDGDTLVLPFVRDQGPQLKGK